MKIKTFFRILEIIGILIFGSAFVCLILGVASNLFIELTALFGLILCIPNNIIFAKKMLSKTSEVSSYWKYKLLAIPICITGFVVAIIFELCNL